MNNTDPFETAGGGEYAPDAERDMALVTEAFFGHIAAEVRRRELPLSLLDAMRARHRELESANEPLVVDPPARYNLHVTLALVAAYQGLLPELGRAVAVGLIEEAVVAPLGDAVRDATRATLDAAPDPFAAMVRLSKAAEVRSYGEGFTFRRPTDDDRSYLLDIHRCFYHDVLAANGAPELTPAMCAFDGNWIEGIDPGSHGFRFERPMTIGRGGTHCQFHFHRLDLDRA